MWFDRCFGRNVNQLPEIIESSRYCCSSPTTLNGHTNLLHGDLLVDDGSGRFLNKGAEQRFYSSEEDLENAVHNDVVISVLQEFQDATNGGRSRSFLIPEKLLAWLHLTDFDMAIQKVVEKGHFHEIVRAPKQDLVYQEYLLPVGRVKRVPATATRHLAAHSECWQKRSFTGVVPKKILALESEDEFRIYENRVFARLLDHLERYLKRRCSEIACIEEALEEREKLDGSEIYWEANNAICSLWGEGFSSSIDQSDEAEQGKDTLRILRRLLKSVLGLKESKLYRAIPEKDDVGFQIRMTNTLTHDQHYRHVAHLWHKWNQHSKGVRVEPSVIYERNKFIANAYFTYCYELVLRALEELGYSEGAVKGSGRYAVSHNKDLSVRVERGNIKLSIEDRSITLIPLMSDVEPQSFPQEAFPPNTVILSPQLHGFDLRYDYQTASPLYFYTLEAIVTRITSWLSLISVDAIKTRIDKVPSEVVSLLGKKYAEYFDVKGHSVLLKKPLGESRSQCVDDISVGFKNVSYEHVMDKIKERADEMDALLRCPACGLKASSKQFRPRDGVAFEIESDTCAHTWRIDRDASAKLYVTLVPKQDGSGTPSREGDFFRYGRYGWSIAVNS